MTETDRPCFAQDSLTASLAEPSELIESSVPIGWTTALLRVYRSSGESDIFDTPETSDTKIVVNLEGQSELRCLSRGMWRSGVKGPGAIGITPGGQTSRLRWRSLGNPGFVQAHLHVPGTLLEESLEEWRAQGAAVSPSKLNTLAMDDPVIATIVLELVQAMRAAVTGLAVEERIRLLAARLTLTAAERGVAAERDPGHLGEVRLARAIEFMTADLAIEHGLEEIARAAGISVFHFARLFKRATGKPPHAFLTDLRLQAACGMLERSDVPVAEVSRLVGYPIARNFNAAFVRRFGSTPGAWRRENRPSTSLRR